MNAEKQQWLRKFRVFMAEDNPQENAENIGRGGSTESIDTVRHQVETLYARRGSHSEREGSTDSLDSSKHQVEPAYTRRGSFGVGYSSDGSQDRLDRHISSTETSRDGSPNGHGPLTHRQQAWRKLSQPKHPKTSLKQLRERIEQDIQNETDMQAGHVPRVQTLPHLYHSSRHVLLGSREQKHRHSIAEGNYLAVPMVTGLSRSHENLSSPPPKPYQSEELIDLKPDPPHGVSNGMMINGRSPSPRRRTSLLSVKGESSSLLERGQRSPRSRSPKLSSRLSVQPEVNGIKSHPGSNSGSKMGSNDHKMNTPDCKQEMSITLPEVKFTMSDD